MNCPECNAPVDGDSRFCKHCGATLQEPADRVKSVATPPSINEGPDIHRDPTQEKPVWHGRPSWRAYAWVWVLWAAISLVLIIYIYLKTEAGGSGAWLRTWVWPVTLTAAVVLLVRQALFILGTRYRITTQRLFVDRGILTRVTDQTELVRVDDVRIRQGVLDRMLDTGQVEVISTDASHGRLVLQSINKPTDVAESLRLHTRAVRGKQTLFVENV